MTTLNKVKDIFFASLATICQMFSKAGQSFFAMDNVNKYFLKTPDTLIGNSISSTAIIGGFGVNLLRAAANFRHCYAPKDVQNEPAPIKLGCTGSIIKNLLLTSAHASGTFTGLNAYLGSVVLLELILESPIAIQILSLIIALNVVKNYYNYDYQFMKRNAIKIAVSIEQKNIPWDIYSAKTIGVSLFNLIAAPGIGYFFTPSALKAVPELETLIHSTGITIITSIAATSAFFSTACTLPSTYDYFANTTEIKYPNTALSRGIRYSTYVAGTIDSLATGSCNFISIVDTGNLLFGLNPYGGTVALGAACGISAFSNNATFLVRPGYLNLMQDIYPQKEKQRSLLINEEENCSDYDDEEERFLKNDLLVKDVEKIKPSFFYNKNKFAVFAKSFGKTEVDNSADNIKGNALSKQGL